MLNDFAEAALMSMVVLSVLQGILLWRPQFLSPVQHATCVYSVQGFNLGLVSLAIFVLAVGFVTSDFSLRVVAGHSQTTTPLFYKITGVWGNHEGSLLLWIWMMVAYGGVLAAARRMDRLVRVTALSFLGLLVGGLTLFLLCTANPFDRLPLAEQVGRGLNPILQDPALAWHPPMLYMGYVGLTIPFVLILSTLWHRRVQELFPASFPRWVYFPMAFMTGGITLGSLWAYYELGWGGWWFWDPVENVSLLPWCFGLALIHSVRIYQARQQMLTWVVGLSYLAFLASLLATFMVRSGLLTTVHAFALDPERGTFFLGFMVLVVILSLLLLGRLPNAAALSGSLLTRGGIVRIQNLGMVLIAVTIFWGTSYPLLLMVLGLPPVTVAAPYFVYTVVPFSLPLLFLMGLSPLATWQHQSLKKMWHQSYWAATFSLLVFVILYLTQTLPELLAAVVFALACWILIIGLWRGLQQYRVIAQYGFLLGHLGFGLSLLGMSADALFQREQVVVLKDGNVLEMFPYKLSFDALDRQRTPEYMGEAATIRIFKNEQKLGTISPEKRFYPTQKTLTTEAAIYQDGLTHVYVILGGLQPNGGRVFKVYVHPLVSLIWIGGLLISLGMLVCWRQRRS